MRRNIVEIRTELCERGIKNSDRNELVQWAQIFILEDLVEKMKD